MNALLLMALFGCGSGQSSPATSEAAPAWNAPRSTQMHRYTVELKLEPDPPPMGELFEVSAVVKTPEGDPVEDAKVVIDARMPEHAHGMETDPVEDPGVCADGACRHPGGVYDAKGFKFHMAGHWAILVEIQGGPRGPDSTSFDYTMGGS